MTDVTVAEKTSKHASSLHQTDVRTKRRNASEARFRFYGLTAIAVGVFALIVLMASILSNGIPAFFQTYVIMNVDLKADVLDPKGNRDPDAGVQLVEIAIGAHPPMGLGNPLSAEEPGLPFVTRASINLHELGFTFIPGFRPICRSIIGP